MIKANELRIGNLVLLNGKIITIEGIDGMGINPQWSESGMEYDFVFGEILNMAPSKLEGVPLTEEWLLKFGFKPISYSMFLPVYNNGKIELANDFSISYNGNNRIIPKYVHQLQNLYLDLKGEELEIKQ